MEIILLQSISRMIEIEKFSIGGKLKIKLVFYYFELDAKFNSKKILVSIKRKVL